MVYLAAVKKDNEILDPSTRQVDSVDTALDENDFYTNLYGSHFAADHLPQHEMPEREMPRQIAARMVKDELSLDGNPKLKLVIPMCRWGKSLTHLSSSLASFVTTYMVREQKWTI